MPSSRLFLLAAGKLAGKTQDWKQADHPPQGWGHVAQSTPLHYSILIARTAGRENYSSQNPSVRVPADYSSQNLLTSPRGCLWTTNANEFCVTPCTSQVLAGPWSVRVGTGEKRGKYQRAGALVLPPTPDGRSDTLQHRARFLLSGRPWRSQGRPWSP